MPGFTPVVQAVRQPAMACRALIAGQGSRPRRRRGNAFVETAFVLLPLFAILFAIVDYSYVIFLRSTFQHAVREGVRYAVTYQTTAGMGHDASIKDVVRTNTMGFLRGSEEDLNRIHIRYYLPDTLVETSANAPGNVIEVSIEGYQVGWMAPLWRTHAALNVNARASDRMEGLAGGSSPPAR